MSGQLRAVSGMWTGASRLSMQRTDIPGSTPLFFEPVQTQTKEKLADVWVERGTGKYFLAEGGVPHVGGPTARAIPPYYFPYPFLLYTYDAVSEKLSFNAYWDSEATPACWREHGTNIKQPFVVTRVA